MHKPDSALHNDWDEPRWTHNGWMMTCPIKLAGYGTDCPIIAARWAVLEPWLTVCHWCQAATIWLLSTLDPSYEPMWMFRITGERA